MERCSPTESVGGKPPIRAFVVGVPGFEPGASASRTLRANQAAPHPVWSLDTVAGASSVRARPFAARRASGGRDASDSGAGDGVEDLVGELGAAHEQVGQVRVGLVVAQRRAVEAGAVAAGRVRRRRRARPSPTRTGRRRARTRRPTPSTTAIALAPAEPIGTSSASSSVGEVASRAPAVGCATRGCGSARRSAARASARGCGREHEVLRGERDRGRDRRAVHDERDVHGPVGAAGFAVLARAVERVDDPDAFARRGAPGRPSTPRRGSRRRDGARAGTAGSGRRPARSPSAPVPPRGAQLDEEVAGAARGVRGERVVVHECAPRPAAGSSSCLAARRNMPASTGFTSMTSTSARRPRNLSASRSSSSRIVACGETSAGLLEAQVDRDRDAAHVADLQVEDDEVGLVLARRCRGRPGRA